MSEFKSSWLVQRLQDPFETDHILSKTNPFDFGGGVKNGGLSDEAMDMLRPLFRFDYMGAAEYEFGSVPEALKRMAELSNNHKLALFPVTTDHGEVYAIGNPKNKNEIVDRIQDWAATPYDHSHRTRDSVGLHQSLTEKSTSWAATGWLELDNGFMFFVNEDRANAVARVFGVES